MSPSIRPLPPLAGAAPTAEIAAVPLRPLVQPPHGPAVDGPTFRDRLIAALRGLARIEGRIAYEADAMDHREPAGEARRGAAANAEAHERLATARERGD